MIRGFSAIVPAKFSIPQNPVGVGKFVPAEFVVPENPLIQAMLPRPDNVVLANLTGCGSTIPGDNRGCRGLGVVSTSATVESAIGWIKKNWLILGAGALLALYLISRRSKPSATTAPQTKANPRRRYRRRNPSSYRRYGRKYRR